MLVAAIVMTMVGLSTGGFHQRNLEFEASRLAQLFSLAREEAQVRGRPIRFVADDIGYRFEALSENQWRLIRDDDTLRERRWDQSTAVRVESADRPPGAVLSAPANIGNTAGLPTILFGREQIDVPFALQLTRDKSIVTLSGDGMGRFKVASRTLAAAVQ